MTLNWKEALWAKKDRKNGGVVRWLPLYLHLQETSLVMNFLWNHWLSEGTKEIIIKQLNSNNNVDEDLVINVCMFLGAVHDIGKATPVFQLKPSFIGDKDLDYEITNHLIINGFRGAESYDIRSVENIHHSISGDFILKRNGVNGTLCSVISAHHGNPKSSNKNMDSIWSSSFYQSEDVESEIYKIWKTVQDDIFKWALNFSGFNGVEELPFVSQTGQVLLSALLIMADWISSNTYYFPLLLIDEEYDVNSRVERGLIKWVNEKTDNWIPNSVDLINIYQNRFSKKDFQFVPRDIQEKITKEIDSISKPGICIIEAPMGLGKTEISLVAAEQLAYKSNKTGIYFALPTQATSNGIFPRIKSWLENLDDNYSNEKSLRLMHSKSELNKDFKSLKNTRDVINYEQEDCSNSNVVTVNDYFNGRKLRILDYFVVGTIDQILLSALKQKHFMLRHLGLSNKVVIIDEVHAYDAYMSVYLYEAIKWLAAYNVPVIILSATLPVKKRNELIKSYMIGAGYKYKKVVKPEGFIENISYPLLSYTDGDNICQFEKFDKDKINKKEINIEKIPTKDFNSIYKIIEEQKEIGGVIGIFLNTVKKAQEVASNLTDLFSQEDILLIHSQFISEERYKKEDELMKLIGKGNEIGGNPNRPFFKVVVGTQVMEQSLDIDFDLIFTELAPMDLLIQRMGRLFRHSTNNRPKNLQKPKVYVLNIGDYKFDKPTTYVYSPYILFRTEYYLPNKITIPNDIAYLVNLVYNDEDISLNSDKLKNIYLKHKSEYNVYVDNKESKAKVFRLANPKMKIKETNNLYGIIDRDNTTSSDEEKAIATVRDSLESLEVICLKYDNGSYKFINGEKISNFSDSSYDIAKQTIRLPAAIFHGSNIDDIIKELESYYVNHLSEWDNIPLLKNSLALVLDRNNCHKYTTCVCRDESCYYFKEYILHYDLFYGLTYTKQSK